MLQRLSGTEVGSGSFHTYRMHAGSVGPNITRRVVRIIFVLPVAYRPAALVRCLKSMIFDSGQHIIQDQV